VGCQGVDPSTGAITQSCDISVKIEADMEPPVYVYYQLDNFYQNHRRYVKSRSDKQLRGEEVDPALLDDCAPLNKEGTKTLNPCGLIANSMFNGKRPFFSLAHTVALTHTPYIL
jgi:hypothetical protein